MLVELGLVEQRYQAVCEVLHGATDVDVARRKGVARQTVHDWPRVHARSSLVGLAHRSFQAPVVSASDGAGRRGPHPRAASASGVGGLGCYPLLVIDEVGYIPFEAERANLFFQLVASR